MVAEAAESSKKQTDENGDHIGLDLLLEERNMSDV